MDKLTKAFERGFYKAASMVGMGTPPLGGMNPPQIPNSQPTPQPGNPSQLLQRKQQYDSQNPITTSPPVVKSMFIPR